MESLNQQKNTIKKPTKKMSKQTAVDWLLEQLDEQVYTIDYFQNRINISISFEDMQAIKKEAKEMEKSNLLRYGFKYYMFGVLSAWVGILISKFI